MVTQDDVERRVSEFVGACRRQGIKATHQRTEIFRELAGTREHPDAETIFARVRERVHAAQHGFTQQDLDDRQPADETDHQGQQIQGPFCADDTEAVAQRAPWREAMGVSLPA